MAKIKELKNIIKEMLVEEMTTINETLFLDALKYELKFPNIFNNFEKIDWDITLKEQSSSNLVYEITMDKFKGRCVIFTFNLKNNEYELTFIDRYKQKTTLLKGKWEYYNDNGVAKCWINDGYPQKNGLNNINAVCGRVFASLVKPWNFMESQKIPSVDIDDQKEIRFGFGYNSMFSINELQEISKKLNTTDRNIFLDQLSEIRRSIEGSIDNAIETYFGLDGEELDVRITDWWDFTPQKIHEASISASFDGLPGINEIESKLKELKII